MAFETIQLLVEAGSTVILAITLLVTSYFLSRSRSSESKAEEHGANATQMTAKSNLLLSEALDSFSAAATRAAELALVQKEAIERSSIALEAQKGSINHVGEAVDRHVISAKKREVASVERDKVTVQAIEALPGKINLVMQADSNALMLQIEVALQDFLTRLNSGQSPLAVEINDSDPIVLTMPQETLDV